MPITKFTELNEGIGGSIMDETGIVYAIPGEPTDRRRARICLAGQNIDDLSEIKNTSVVGNEYGLIVRNIPDCPSGTDVIFDTVSSVNSNNLTVVATYTVPSAKSFYLTGFAGTGDLPAIFRIYVDGSPSFALRTTAACPNANMNFAVPALKVAAGSIVTLQVIHYTSGITGDFEGSILGFTV
jgi:hypothetical protein